MGVMKRLLESKQGSRRGSLYDYTQGELDAYNRGWSSFMVNILHEQIDRLQISDSKKLYSSLTELVSTGNVTTIEHKFLMYGLYVAAGVGKGFEHGNMGNLMFMGDIYRNAHGEYRTRQVGAGLSESAMLSPKFERIPVRYGKNAGKEAALTSGNKRQAKDWFFKKYYYSLHKLNEENARFFGEAYQGLTSSLLEALFADVSSQTRIKSNRF